MIKSVFYRIKMSVETKFCTNMESFIKKESGSEENNKATSDISKKIVAKLFDELEEDPCDEEDDDNEASDNILSDADEENEDEDEPSGNDVPDEEDDEELKKLVDEVVGQLPNSTKRV